MHAFWTLLRSLSSIRRRQLLMTLCLMLAGALAEIVAIGATIPFFTFLLGSGTAAPNRLTDWVARLGIDSTVSASLLLMAAAVAAAAIRLQLLWLNQRFVMGVSHDIATAMFSRMLRQPYVEYVKRNSSEALASIEKVRDIAAGVIQPLMQGITASVMALFIGGLLFAISPFAATAALGTIGIVYVAISRLSRRRLKANSTILARSLTERTKMIQEGMGAIRDILIDGSQPVFEESFRSADLRFRQAVSTNVFISQSPRFIIEAAGIIIIVLIALAMSTRTGGILSAVPTLGALALGAQRMLPLVQQVYSGWSSALSNLQSVNDIAAMMAAPIVSSRPCTDQKLPFRDAVTFRNVSFAYGRGGFVLEKLDLSIDRGSRLGIVGTTGSGKSTLLDLLMGLLEPSEGEILIDGQPLDQNTRPLWQAQLAHVPQTIYLIDDSIAANIAFGSPAELIDMPRVVACARAAHLAELIENWPEAYDTKVGERGIRLSGGQRQRIGIARALYKGAALLILDEATSALDAATEASIMRAIMEIGREITIVIVAHRHSTLESCDRIFRLESGRLVA